MEGVGDDGRVRDFKGLGRLCARWEGEASSDEDGVEASAGGVLEEASEVEGLEELSSGGLGFVMDRWVRRRHTSSLLVLLVLLLFLFFLLLLPLPLRDGRRRGPLRVLARRRATLVVASLGTHTAFRRRRRSEKKKREEARRRRFSRRFLEIQNPTSCQLQL